MKAVPDIKKTAEQIAAPTVKAHAARQRLQPGKTTQMSVAGKSVGFKLVKIDHADIETKTEVWEGNERDQFLLTDAALSDIQTSIKENGQENPGKGRTLPDGTIQVADGSRRRMSCIKSGQDYFIWVSADLSDKDMDHLTEVGNQYKPTSAYERGKRYLQIKDRENFKTKEAWAMHIGIDRKTMDRCIRTSKLPECIVSLYPTVNDISARAGEKIQRSLTDYMVEMAESGQIITAGKDPDQITTEILRYKEPETEKTVPERTWSDNSLKLNRKGNGMKIEIANDVPADKLDKIEKMIRRELGIKENQS